MEYVLNNISNIFPEANLDVAACLDEEMPYYCSLTLLLHSMQQTGDELEDSELEEEPVSSEAAPGAFMEATGDVHGYNEVVAVIEKKLKGEN